MIVNGLSIYIPKTKFDVRGKAFCLFAMSRQRRSCTFILSDNVERGAFDIEMTQLKRSILASAIYANVSNYVHCLWVRANIPSHSTRKNIYIHICTWAQQQRHISLNEKCTHTIWTISLSGISFWHTQDVRFLPFWHCGTPNSLADSFIKTIKCINIIFSFAFRTTDPRLGCRDICNVVLTTHVEYWSREPAKTSCLGNRFVYSLAMRFRQQTSYLSQEMWKLRSHGFHRLKASSCVRVVEWHQNI